jgi:hypothetical protein
MEKYDFQQDPELAKKMALMQYFFTLLLFVVFLTLKLTGVIAWSWWWVTSPLWIPIALGLIVAMFVGF